MVRRVRLRRRTSITMVGLIWRYLDLMTRVPRAGLSKSSWGTGMGHSRRRPQRYHLAGAGPAIVARDINGDGFDDLVFTTAQRVGVLMNLGGTFAPPVYYASGGGHPSGLVVADFNGDGVLDVAASRGKELNIAILLGNPSLPGTFALPAFIPTGGNASAIAVGDFNGDGVPDLAVTNSDFEKTALAVIIGNGDGTFRPAAMYGGANFSDSVAAGDFAGTGIQDIIVGSFDSELKLYPGNGDGTFGTPIVVDGGQFTQQIRTADFNSDGRLDLMVTPYSGARVLMNTTGSVTPPPVGTGLDKTLGAGNPKSFTFYTPEGTKATVSLSGPGSATLHFSDSGTVDLPDGRGTRTVTSLTIADIAATGTTTATALTLTAFERSGSQTINLDSISADSAIGSITGNRVNVTGNIALAGGAGQITLLSANGGTIALGAGRAPNIQMQQIGGETINASAGISQLRVRLDASIALNAPSIGSLSIGGNLINSTITLTNPVASGVMDVRNVSISSDMSGSVFSVAGNIGTIGARSMLDTVIQAGIGPLPPGSTLPASDADFVSTASIKNVTLRPDSRRVTFSNSVITASQVGGLTLGRIQTDNGGVPFGIAGRSIRNINGSDITTGKSFGLSNVTSTAEASAALTAKGIDPQDLVIEIL